MTEKTNIKAVVAAFVGISTLMLAGLAVPRGEFVLVVGRPGTTEAGLMDIIARAGGTFVSPGRVGWLAVAHADIDGFSSRLIRSGALLVVDHSLAAGCLQGG